MGIKASVAVLALLCFCIGQVGGHEGALLEEVKSVALIEAAPALLDPQGGAWVDVDEDGDLDFVLPGDPAKGVHLQLLRNMDKGNSFVAEPLDSKVESLPDASVSQCATESFTETCLDALPVNILGSRFPKTCS